MQEDRIAQQLTAAGFYPVNMEEMICSGHRKQPHHRSWRGGDHGNDGRAGAEITLSTAAEGAAIPYTLNDTCPYTGGCFDLHRSHFHHSGYSAPGCRDFGRSVQRYHPPGAAYKTDPSGGGGAGGGNSSFVNHTVETAAAARGTVTDSPNHAGKGDTVIITVKPGKEYVLHTLTVAVGTGKDMKFMEMGDGMYRFIMPDSKVTVNAVSAQNVEILIAFTDVYAEDDFYDAVIWAVDHNVTSGITGTAFIPDMACPRAQTVTFLWRTAGSPQPEK